MESPRLLSGRLPRLTFSENTILISLAVSVGLATAGAVYLFRQGIDFFTVRYREALQTGLLSGLGPLAIIPIVAFGGLVVGLLVDRFIGVERHHGVAGIMESVAYSGGRLPYRKIPAKAFLAALSLGVGASTGPEDPSVQIGANLGSFFGQRLRLSDDRVRLLVAAGAAGGIASAFRAPIAGVFFALEVLLGDLSTGAFSVVVLASVIASVFTQAIEVGGPELGIRTYALGGIQNVPLYVVLGLVIAPLAALFMRLFYWQEDLWHHLPLPRPLKTALAGALVGAIAIFLPQVLGTGRETMNAILNQHSAEFSIGILLALTFGKMLASTFSLGGGFLGGTFAPSLFIGAAFGGAFGQLVNSLFVGSPGLGDPAAFAMAGMAAMMTGVMRAPITAVLLLFELTNDYNLILPLMLAVAVCLIVVERISADGIYQHGLARKGIRLSRGRDIDLLQIVTVSDSMSEPRVIHHSESIAALSTIFEKTQTHGLAVVDDQDHLYGIVTVQDLARAREEGQPESATVAQICTKEVLTVTPSTSIATALQLIGERDLGRLPVVDEADRTHVVGILRRRDIMRAYDLAIQRKQTEQHGIHQARLGALTGAIVLEFRVESGSAADGKRIREVTWPPGCVVASIERSGKIVPPNGDTLLAARDRLTMVVSAGKQDSLEALLTTRR